MPVTVTVSPGIRRCPRCGNNANFHVHTQQVSEDGCVVWATCAWCGFDPFDMYGMADYKYESVTGIIDIDSAENALRCWNDCVQEYREMIRKAKEAGV